MRLAVLTSGEIGSTVLEQIANNWQINFVMTDKDSGRIQRLCKNTNIPYFIGNPRNGKCSNFLSDKEIDVLVSVNYLFIIENNLIQLPKKIAFNIHGSILPKYRGRTPHVWAIINGETTCGITAHRIELGCDEGAIVKQKKIAINKADSGGVILEKYSKQYFPLIKAVMDIIVDANHKHRHKAYVCPILQKQPFLSNSNRKSSFFQNNLFPTVCS